MSANSFGELFKMTSFGESHGPAIGVLIEGCPAGLEFNHQLLINNLNRRRPGQSSVTTSRTEPDMPTILSGIFQNKTLGTPICIMITNSDQNSQNYDDIKDNARIGHADDTWKAKFSHVDHRGGGRASARETVARVIGGSFAQMLVQQIGSNIQMLGFASTIGKYELSPLELANVWNENVDSFKTRFPSAQNENVIAMLEKAKLDGESYGGIVELRIKNAPTGLGQPVFHKIKADLAAAMMSIGASAGVELGQGFSAASVSGKELHQSMQSASYGGIRGGITTGEEIILRVAFKPTSSIKDVAKEGRHDPCIVPRAVPIVEAMAWMVLADHLLWSRLDRI